MSDPNMKDDMDGAAAVDEDSAFDGDANSDAALAGAVADSSTDAADRDGPPADGGVVGGVPGRASVPGATDAADAAEGELPPEEMGK